MSKKRISLRNFETAIDRIVREAQERGEFDDLPGAGKPIPGLDRPHDELWWLKGLLKREDLGFLPPALELRRDVERALEKLANAPTETAVRRIVNEINERIRKVNATTHRGPSSTVAPLDVEEALTQWQRARQRRT